MNWLDVGKMANPNPIMHPSGNNSDEDYWYSGEHDAFLIHNKIYADSVLEFGCGNGRILQNLYYAEVYGVDISPELIAGLDNAFLVKDFDKKVDAVFSLNVLIHLKRGETCEAIKWIYDHLNDDGKAYLQIPIYDSDREPDSLTDVGVWSEKSFRDFVGAVGFTIVDLYTNSGSFSYSNIGPNHNEFQVLSK
jgi:SAM-dependent methyltransferase